MSEEKLHEEHFEDLEKQAHAAKLGMAIFLGSEALIFAALFALIAAYQTHYPKGWQLGINHNTIYLGSINTANIIIGSTIVASSVHTMRKGLRRTTAALIIVGIVIALGFAAIKLVEYQQHFSEGIYPGGQGEFFHEHPAPGVMEFWNLYFIATGLHLVHLTVGVAIMAWLVGAVLKGTVNAEKSHPVLIGAMYWQLVDSVWMFLWPIFYLK